MRPAETDGTQPLLVQGGHVLDPATGRDAPADILVISGRIADIGSSLSGPEGTLRLDARGHTVFPGLVDLSAFVGEPGAEHRETLRTASAAAAAGGVTTLLAMPDTSPPVDDPALVDFVKRRAREASVVNVLPAAALTKGLAGREMTEFGLLLDAGAFAFTDGARSVADARVMRRALTYARDFGALVIHHTHDAALAGDGVMNEGERASRLGLPGAPREAETIMLERDLALVRLTGARYHAAALTCAASLSALRRAKEAGLPVTASATINHLTLNENDVGDYRTFCKVSPPLRSEEDRLALVEAVASGLVDVVVSDHNPQDVETKRRPFAESADGAVGLETLLSAALRLVHAGLITPSRLVEAMSFAPARLLGLESGRIARGAPADLALVDLDRPWVVDRDALRSRSKNSPFDEARLTGRVVATIVGGRVVFQLDEDGPAAGSV